MEKEKLLDAGPLKKTEKKSQHETAFGEHKTCYVVNLSMGIDPDGKPYPMSTQISWKRERNTVASKS